MTTVYLIRHAEADGNLYRRAQGHFDGQITSLGKKQIAALAERFRDVELDALYTSDLSRTRETSGAILKYHDLPLNIDPSLREICMGVWENRLWGDLSWEEPDMMEAFAKDPDRWYVPGCESFPKLQERITGAVTRIAAENDGRTIAIVSHGMAIRSLVCGAKGIPSEQVSRIPHGDNTCVALLQVEGGVIDVQYYNDNSHLPNALSTFAKQSWWHKGAKEERNNLRGELLRLPEERSLYLDCYRSAWSAVHGGDLSGFRGASYLESAQSHVAVFPESIMKMYDLDEFAGVIELDTRRGAEHGVGWISLVYLAPESRGRRRGIQLIGHAVTVYRKLGRKCLRLHVSEENQAAIGFYEHYGFARVGEDEGVRGKLLLMEKEL